VAVLARRTASSAYDDRFTTVLTDKRESGGRFPRSEYGIVRPARAAPFIT
jgi:hypothetical protein